MRLDHISYAAGQDGLTGTVQRLTDVLGEKFQDGGVHPRFGTRNAVLPLVGQQFLEIVEVLDHPASDKAPFGQAVRQRSEAGGGWLGWVVAVDDITQAEQRLGRESVPGNRHRPDGIELRWRQIGVNGLLADPQLPFFVQWESELEHHPSAGASGEVALTKLEIAGDPHRVTEWMGEDPARILHSLDVEWVAPHGTPGVIAAHFATSGGVVRILHVPAYRSRPRDTHPGRPEFGTYEVVAFTRERERICGFAATAPRTPGDASPDIADMPGS